MNSFFLRYSPHPHKLSNLSFIGTLDIWVSFWIFLSTYFHLMVECLRSSRFIGSLIPRYSPIVLLSHSIFHFPFCLMKFDAFNLSLYMDALSMLFLPFHFYFLFVFFFSLDMLHLLYSFIDILIKHLAFVCPSL